MRVAGIAVELVSPHRPTTWLVVLNDASGSASLETSVPFPTAATDLATQLHDTATAVRSRLKGLAVDRVVLRRADFPPRPSKKEGPRLRLLMEGAVVSAARSVVVDTRVGTGQDTGTWFGSDKAGVDSASSALLSAAGVSNDYVEATSAGLAGLKAP